MAGGTDLGASPLTTTRRKALAGRSGWVRWVAYFALANEHPIRRPALFTTVGSLLSLSLLRLEACTSSLFIIHLKHSHRTLSDCTVCTYNLVTLEPLKSKEYTGYNQVRDCAVSILNILPRLIFLRVSSLESLRRLKYVSSYCTCSRYMYTGCTPSMTGWRLLWMIPGRKVG